MQRTLLYLLLLTCLSCSPSDNDEKENITSGKSFIEDCVDMAISDKNENVIELPYIYNSLVTELPSDSMETIKLAELLKKKGFIVTTWGRGNFPPLGVRIINLTLKREDCTCEVSKIYYKTISEGYYNPVERISCTDK